MGFADYIKRNDADGFRILTRRHAEWTLPGASQ
jgi:hypothetical protein